MAGGFCIQLVLTNGSRKEWIKKALEAIKNAGLPAERCDESIVLSLTKRDNNMYVCDPFEGDAFTRLLELGCRIVGPQCVLSCLKNEMAVPKVDHPIYSMSMHHVTISCSNVEKAQRARIHKLVQWMGGTVSKNFTDTVTHLIANEVGSKKYHVAASLDTPVMLPDWVYSCWELGKERYVCATDENVMTEFSCPVFKGCVICVTGLESDERTDIRTLAAENGGEYTGEMKFNECTHLIVNNPKGPKYEFARKWKIHCVNSKWFFESVKKGYCQDENLYPVASDIQATSTPIRMDDNPRLSSRPSVANFSAISNVSMVSTVDDSAMTESVALVTDQHTTMRDLDELELTLGDAALFLDGCKIFLSGFSGARLEKLRKIINAGGATRFNQINESVSHVVLGDRTPDHIAMLRQSSHRPHVVSSSWLVDCYKQSCQLQEESYICLDLPPVPSASPAAHLRSEKPRTSLASRSGRSRDSTKQSVSEPEDEDADVMQQYLPGKADPNDTTADAEIVFKMPQVENNLTSTQVKAGDEEDETQMEEEDLSEDDDVTMLEERVDGFFSGKTFVILGFPLDQEEQILEMIVGQGGQVKKAGTRCVADIAVVPINGCEVNADVGEVVSNCWLQMCLEEAQYLLPSSNPLFSPIVIVEEATPLTECVLTVSQYSGVERDCLIHIAELLGARCQEYFSRKATHELKPNTHLLLKEATGSKYKAAKKWKVPAVTKDWLLESARRTKRQPEDSYLIDWVANQQDHSELTDQPAMQQVEHITQQADNGKTSSAQEPGQVPPPRMDLDNQRADHELKLEEHPVLEVNKEARNTIRLDAKVLRQEEECTGTLAVSRPLHGGNEETKQGMVAMDWPRDSPAVNKHLAVCGSGAAVSKDTPSKFLGEGAVFHPAFDTKDALEFLESPAGLHPKRRHARKSSLPLDDFFHMNVAKAVQKSGEQTTEDEGNDSVFHEQVKSKGVLDGIIICVSKKLIATQRDYNAAAVGLGAEFRWTFDDSCTHFIFKGRSNDTSKEFRAARDKGMFIVSPFWLLACEEEERRVDEASYPHTFNPKMSLSVMSTRLETPSRTPARPSRQTRSMARTPAVTHQAPPPSTHQAPPPSTHQAPPPSTHQAPPPSTHQVPPPSTHQAPPPSTPNPPPPSTPQPPPPSTPQPPPPIQDETAMDGFGEGSTDSEDEELLRMVEAAERGDEDGGTTAGREDELGSGVNDDQGSLEQKENLQKQLEGIMSSTMNARGGRRRSRIHKTSSSTASATSAASTTTSGRERSTGRGSGRRTRSSRALAHGDEGGPGALGATLTVRPPDLHHEASQNVQITWDDPTGRKEREKIMAQLKRSCSPSQNSLEMESGNARMNEEVTPDKSRVSVHESTRSPTMSALHREASRETDPSPTPQAPPIRLPVANPPVAPQPVLRKPEEPHVQVQTALRLKFLLSGMRQEEKIDYSALVEQLGGEVKDEMYFDPSCTHLVVGNPTRNEKYLASLASGKWVLHKSFFEACRKAGQFVEEEPHEWGNATDLSSLNEQAVKLALAACRWRRQLQHQQQYTGGDREFEGAFHGWKVLLYIDRSKETSFKRILLAGGAKVMGMRPPFSNLHDVTHAFMDLQKTKTPEGVLDLEAIASAGILCLRPEYIADFLMQDPAPDHTKYFINEIKPIMESISGNAHHTRSSRTPSKRKRHDAAQTPRSKKGRMR